MELLVDCITYIDLTAFHTFLFYKQTLYKREPKEGMHLYTENEKLIKKARNLQNWWQKEHQQNIIQYKETEQHKGHVPDTNHTTYIVLITWYICTLQIKILLIKHKTYNNSCNNSFHYSLVCHGQLHKFLYYALYCS